MQAAEPLQTLARAQAVVRTLDGDMSGNITVNLADGTYRLSQPLQFGPQDSGTNGYDVIWTGPADGGAVVSGAEQITGGTLHDPAKNIWAAPVPAGLQTRQIYVNGMRATLAAGEPPVALAETATGYVAASSVYARPMTTYTMPAKRNATFEAPAAAPSTRPRPTKMSAPTSL